MGAPSAGALRLAQERDMDEVMGIYDRARGFMRAHGNATQWVGGYPSRELVEADRAAGHLWVLEGAGGGLLAVMAVMPGPDPTYAHIEGAPWLDEGPYWVMHRLVVGEPGHGAGSRCLAWLCARHGNVRADTHADNLPMQRTLERAGFVRCGTVTVADGTPRLAYHFLRGRESPVT